jgi:hypothetical protein
VDLPASIPPVCPEQTLKKLMHRTEGVPPLPPFLEVLILKDFKSLFPELLILKDFKSLSPEVLILVDLKSLIMSAMEKLREILEVLILVDFIFSRINRSEKLA